ncbi:histidine--tRNA ligase [Candidatus Parcubacteria bacterium]|nr:histidine--tRNA ligase [Candidatus Parcubacteria bacterium]
MDEKNTKNSLSTEPYKGVRDFYPEDMFVQNYIFSVMRKTVESFGYVEYGASILEPSELYKSKTSDEIVNEQTYSFKDRGDRDVTLRPEMTPTVTRMVAAKKRELSFPLRWYSIPNLFRYEKPQRGRLREHFQLNVDLFGIESVKAEVEVITVAHTLMLNFGADQESFEIKINNRKILNYLLQEVYTLNDETTRIITRLIDKKHKISGDEFKSGIEKVLKDKTDSFIDIINTKTIDEFAEKAAEKTSSEILGVKETKELIETLKAHGVKNAKFDPTLARGFDYYTGIVFEVYDMSPANNRSLFGGGRYDDLLSVFGTEKVPAVGFGMGDVTIRDYLETYNFLPKYKPNIDLAICTLNPEVIPFASDLAQKLRKEGVQVALNLTDKKLSQQIQWADKNSIPYILCIGENELKDKKYVVKELSTGTETEFHSEQDIAVFLKKI